MTTELTIESSAHRFELRWCLGALVQLRRAIGKSDRVLLAVGYEVGALELGGLLHRLRAFVQLSRRVWGLGIVWLLSEAKRPCLSPQWAVLKGWFLCALELTRLLHRLR